MIVCGHSGSQQGRMVRHGSIDMVSDFTRIAYIPSEAKYPSSVSEIHSLSAPLVETYARAMGLWSDAVANCRKEND